MARRFRSAFVLAGLAGWAFFSAGCKSYSSRQTLDPHSAVARLRAGGDIKDEVDRLAQPLIEKGEVASLAVGVLTPDGTVRTFGYGDIARHNKQRPAGDTIFEIGSITKLFVASTLAVLVEEGRLSYNDTVRSILPPEVKMSAEVGNLTLYDLVTHRSGIPRHPHTLRQWNYLMDYFVTGKNPYRFITRDYLYEFLGDCRIPPRARRGYVYSNLAYGVLGHLMELKTGQSLPELIDEKICRPLNMRDTSFSLNEQQRARLAEGHAGDQPQFIRRNKPLPGWEMGEIMRASGGMYSTTHDLMIFAKSNLGLLGHRLDPLLISTQRPEMKTPEEDVAYGWIINHFGCWSTSIHYMNGLISGYTAYIGMDTDKRVAVTVLYSNFNWQDKVGHNLVLRVGGAASKSLASDREPSLEAHNTTSELNNSESATQ